MRRRRAARNTLGACPSLVPTRTPFLHRSRSTKESSSDITSSFEENDGVRLVVTFRYRCAERKAGAADALPLIPFIPTVVCIAVFHTSSVPETPDASSPRVRHTCRDCYCTERFESSCHLKSERKRSTVTSWFISYVSIVILYLPRVHDPSQYY